MSTFLSTHVPRLAALLAALALTLPCAAVATAALGSPAQVIKSAACNGYKQRDNAGTSSGCDGEGGIANFVAAADAVVSPAVIAMIAVAPIACLVGAGAMMFGSRRGLTIIGAALGTLVFVISIKGIVA